MKCESNKQAKSARKTACPAPRSNECPAAKKKQRPKLRHIEFGVGFINASDSFARIRKGQRLQMATFNVRIPLVGNKRLQQILFSP